MDMFGTIQLKTSRERVWQAFRDPNVMKHCIPGCADFEWAAGGRGIATAAIVLGPIAGNFKGEIQLHDVVPPVTCTISGEASGGAKGFVTGVAKVRLDETSEGTEVSYFAEARICRTLTGLGSRRVEAAAKELTGRFFKTLRESIEGNASTYSIGRPAIGLG